MSLLPCRTLLGRGSNTIFHSLQIEIIPASPYVSPPNTCTCLITLHSFYFYQWFTCSPHCSSSSLLSQMARFPFLKKLNNVPPYRYTIDYTFFIHLPVNRHFACLHAWAIVDNAAMNMGVQLSLGDPDSIFSGYIIRSRIAASYGSSIFTVLR